MEIVNSVSVSAQAMIGKYFRHKLDPVIICFVVDMFTTEFGSELFNIVVIDTDKNRRSTTTIYVSSFYRQYDQLTDEEQVELMLKYS